MSLRGDFPCKELAPLKPKTYTNRDERSSSLKDILQIEVQLWCIKQGKLCKEWLKIKALLIFETVL